MQCMILCLFEDKNEQNLRDNDEVFAAKQFLVVNFEFRKFKIVEN